MTTTLTPSQRCRRWWRPSVAAVVVTLTASLLAQAQDRDVAATARAFVEAGQPKRALALLDAHLATVPDDVPALVWRGAARLKAALDDAVAGGPTVLARLKSEWPKSLADLDRAITLDPSSAEGYFWRGYWYAVDGKNARAIADYDRAIAADPGVANYWCERGIAKERRNDLRGARADYLAALARDPSHANAREWLGSVEPRLGLPATVVADSGLMTTATSPAPGIRPSPSGVLPPVGARPSPPAPTVQPTPATVPVQPSSPTSSPVPSQSGALPPGPPVVPTPSASSPADSSLPASLGTEVQGALDAFSRAVLFVAAKDSAEPSLFRAIYETPGRAMARSGRR